MRYRGRGQRLGRRRCLRSLGCRGSRYSNRCGDSVSGCFQRFFFSRGFEGQQAQQHHTQACIFIWRQAQLVAAVDANAVQQLGFVCGQDVGQARNFGGIGVGFVYWHAGHGLLHGHALQDTGHVFQRAGGRKPLLLQHLHTRHELCGIAFCQRCNQPQHMAATHAAQHLPHGGLLYTVATGKGNGLIGERQGIAHGAARAARQQVQGAGFCRDVLGLQNLLQVRGNGLRHHGAQIELQAAAQYCHRHFLRVGGGEYEFEVFGRLFQRLQHGVEGRVGEHVHLVDHEDLEAPLHRLVHGLLQQALHFVHAAIAGGVQLGVIDKTAGINRRAGRALAAGRGGNAAGAIHACAVERFGQNARDGGFAHTTRAGKQIGMVQPLLLQRIGKRLHHVLLPHHFTEMTGTIFASQHQIRHGLHSRACSHFLAHAGMHV